MTCNIPNNTVLKAVHAIHKGIFNLKKVWVAGCLSMVMVHSGPVHAQKADSLRRVLSEGAVPDTTRVNVYAGLAWEHKNRNTNTDSIQYYANKGLILANAINYRKGEAICSLYLGIAYTLKAEYEEALLNLNGALSYYDHTPASKELNELYHNVALTYYLQTQLDAAITYIEQSKQVAIAINNKSRLARAYLYLGEVHNELSNFTVSLENYLKALELYEQGGKKNDAANCMTNIATLYAQLKDYNKANEYVNRSLEIYSRSSNLQEVYQNYSNIGTVYGMMGEHDRAMQLFEKGRALTDSVDDGYWNSVFLINIAEEYTSTGKLKEALGVYRLLLERSNQIEDITFRYSTLSGLGKILFRQGERKEGIRHMQEAIKLMEANRLKRLVMETAQTLADMYEEVGDHTQALAYTKLHHVYKDSIYNDKNDRKFQQLQFDYELEKKQRQIEQLQKNKEIQKAKTEKQGVITWSLAAAMLLSAVIIVLMYRSRTRAQRNKVEILKQKAEIELQAEKLEELNNFKDKTFSVLSHDLRGPINSITAAVQMLHDKEITMEEYAELKPEINKQLNSLNLLLDNVLLWAKSYIKDDKKAHPAPTNLLEMTTRTLLMLQDTAERKHIGLVNKVDAAVVAICDAAQMEIVVRNLVMNSIKYSNPGGTITIGSACSDSKVQLYVQDTGVGMTKEQVAGLFTARNGRNTYGTEGEIGIGLGLLLCYEFVKVNQGTIAVTSEPGKGSSFTITLPAA